MSSIVKFDDKKDFVSYTRLKPVPKFNISSIYKQMIISLLDTSFYYINTYLTGLT